jgi:cytochrome P450
MTAQINDIKQARDQSSNNRAKGTIFNEILDSDIPSSEKTTTRLAEEAAGIVGGGIDTTKWAAAVTCFHIINNPLVLERLREELKIAFPNGYDATELSQLENLPYLMACVEEGIHAFVFIKLFLCTNHFIFIRSSSIIWLCNTFSADPPG